MLGLQTAIRETAKTKTQETLGKRPHSTLPHRGNSSSREEKEEKKSETKALLFPFHLTEQLKCKINKINFFFSAYTCDWDPNTEVVWLIHPKIIFLFVCLFIYLYLFNFHLFMYLFTGVICSSPCQLNHR